MISGHLKKFVFLSTHDHICKDLITLALVRKRKRNELSAQRLPSTDATTIPNHITIDFIFIFNTIGIIETSAWPFRLNYWNNNENALKTMKSNNKLFDTPWSCINMDWNNCKFMRTDIWNTIVNAICACICKKKHTGFGWCDGGTIISLQDITKRSVAIWEQLTTMMNLFTVAISDGVHYKITLHNLANLVNW